MRKQQYETRVNGVSIAYQVSGSGPPLVCCHAMGWDHTLWDNIRGALSKRHTLITLDQRGCGASEHPPLAHGDANPYTVDTFADDLEGVLDELGLQQANILGFSMGAVAALRLATRAPERVERLVLASAMASRLPEPIIERARKVAQMVETDGLAQTYRFYFSGPLFEGVPRTPAFNQQLDACVRWATPHGFLGCFGVTIDRPSMADDLHEISAPTLILVGERDVHYLDEAELMATRIPRAEKVIVPEVGHAMSYQAPALFVDKVLSFLP